MSFTDDDPKSNGETSSRRADGVDSMPSEELPSWMKSALGGGEDPSVDVLRGVQDRLRVRSGGKFYADGWSTTRHPPFATYFITALLMLVTVVVIYSIVSPIIPDPVPQTRPVQVVPPH